MKTLLVPHIACYAPPKSVPTNRGPTFPKGWVSKRRPQTYLPYSRPNLGALPPLWQWCLDHPLLLRRTHLPLMPQTRRGKGPKEARASKVSRREKSLTPHTNPQPRRPEQVGANKRKAPPLEPLKRRREIDHPSLLFGGLYSP